MKIYELTGTAWVYDSSTDWRVAIYTTIEQAELHKSKLEEIIENPNHDKYTIASEMQRLRYNPDFNINCEETKYEVKEIDLYRHFDEYLEFNDK